MVVLNRIYTRNRRIDGTTALGSGERRSEILICGVAALMGTRRTRPTPRHRRWSAASDATRANSTRCWLIQNDLFDLGRRPRGPQSAEARKKSKDKSKDKSIDKSKAGALRMLFEQGRAAPSADIDRLNAKLTAF